MFSLRRCWQNIIRSFFDYVRARYGSEWLRHLTHKRPTPLISEEGPLLSPSSKRQCCRGHDAAGKSARRHQGGKSDVCPPPVDSHELVKDLTRGLCILGQVLHCTWWEWTSGSSLFFWRWNGEEQIREARNGLKIFVCGDLSFGRRTKTASLTLKGTGPFGCKKGGRNDTKRIPQCWVCQNTVHYLAAVPKGPTDVRIVYDGTSCGLNERVTVGP